jgi:hypothetical protein
MKVRIINPSPSRKLEEFSINGKSWTSGFPYDEESGEYSMTQEDYDYLLAVKETSDTFRDVLKEIKGRNNSPALISALYEIYDRMEQEGGKEAPYCGGEVIAEMMYDLEDMWEGEDD